MYFSYVALSEENLTHIIRMIRTLPALGHTFASCLKIVRTVRLSIFNEKK